jgi:hypothetical protein
MMTRTGATTSVQVRMMLSLQRHRTLNQVIGRDLDGLGYGLTVLGAKFNMWRRFGFRLIGVVHGAQQHPDFLRFLTFESCTEYVGT